ncbi:MAG: DUF2783 domain-containing protein [Burkholderiales bacterium]|nr:DUF2783 domain-containing protein [Burkholderiales bacterium]
MLTPDQLDEAYTAACRAMGGADAQGQALFLARLALLLMKEVGDAKRIAVAIEAARAGATAS